MSRGKLLVIDDDPDVGDLFGRIGRKQGFETRLVNHPEEFKALCETFEPDIIMLDIFMPEADGFELLQYLGTRNCQAHVILTSGNDQHCLSSARRLADAYGLTLLDPLSKPVDFEDLARQLERATHPIKVSHAIMRIDHLQPPPSAPN